MKKQKTLLSTIRSNLKKLAKRLAEVCNAATVAAAGLQATGVVASLPVMLQLKILTGIALLNMVVHRIRYPHELEEQMKVDKKTKKCKAKACQE